MHTYMYISIYISLYIHIYVHMYIYIYIYVYIFVCLYVCISISLSLSPYTYMHMYIYIYSIYNTRVSSRTPRPDGLCLTISLSVQFLVFSNIQCILSGLLCKFEIHPPTRISPPTPTVTALA